MQFYLILFRHIKGAFYADMVYMCQTILKGLLRQYEMSLPMTIYKRRNFNIKVS